MRRSRSGSMSIQWSDQSLINTLIRLGHQLLLFLLHRPTTSLPLPLLLPAPAQAVVTQLTANQRTKEGRRRWRLRLEAQHLPGARIIIMMMKSIDHDNQTTQVERKVTQRRRRRKTEDGRGDSCKWRSKSFKKNWNSHFFALLFLSKICDNYLLAFPIIPYVEIFYTFPKPVWS